MSRGDHRELIFRDDRDRQRFLETLAKGCAKTGWQVHAYCLNRRGWTEATLRQRPKGDASKVKLAERVRAETVQTVEWLAQRLHLGSRAYAHHLLWRSRRNARRQ
jgi:hypothetical protein